MEFLKEYTTKGKDSRKIIIFRMKKDNEKTEYEKNRPNTTYFWVRLCHEKTYWFTTDEKYLKDIPTTEEIIIYSTSSYHVNKKFYMEEEYEKYKVIRERKEKLKKLNEYETI
jgi:hypothetical protein